MYNINFSNSTAQLHIFTSKRLLVSFFFVILLLFTLPLSAQEYAYIYIDNGTGTNSVGTTWTNVGTGSAADFVEGTTSTYWSYSGNVLTAANNASVEGNYCIKYSLSFNADIADWSVGVSIDGAAPTEPVFVRTISNANKDAGNISGILMVSITQNQTVELVIKSSVAAKDFTPEYAQLTLCPAAQNTGNYYGGMHIDASTTYSNLGTSFAKQIGFSAVAELNDWTYGTNDLTAGSSAAGTYYMSYSVSFTGDAKDIRYTFELVKNNTTGLTHILTNRSASTADIGNVSAGGIVSISSGDIISLYAKAGTPNNDLTIEKATISLFKLGDTTPNACASMKITGDQSVTISTQNTWTTIGEYTLNSANLWSLSSNVFTLNSTNAYGYYFLEYSTSLTTANTGGDNIEMGVFIGTTLNSELMVSRSLSSNTDVGVVCGVGLFQVDGPDSTVTLKIRNITSSNNLTIKKSLLGFSQIRYVSSDTPLPITLTSFTATAANGTVELVWETATETNNARFIIYRNDEAIASVDGAGTTTEPHSYTFTDNTVIPGVTYTYVLADVDYANDETRYEGNAITVTANDGLLAADFTVGAAYPNPFNPMTIVPLTITRDAIVRATLYDINGREIKGLLNRNLSAGAHTISIDGSGMTTGLYLVQIEINNVLNVQKIALMK